jgi:AraC-like DNA-binding protein
MATIASGQIAMWEGGSLWLFDVPQQADAPERNAMHAHHALQLTFSIGGEFRLHLADRIVRGPVGLVGADVEHSFEARGVNALLFAEPESRTGRALAERFLCGAPAVSLSEEALGGAPAKIAAAFRGGASKETLAALGQALSLHLSNVGRVEEPDARVRRMIHWANAQLDQPVGIAEAAKQVGLSSGRASHLFVEQTGLPFRTYLLWLRLNRAVECYSAGASLTDAAHEAGFSDSAHFSRTFRRMFGLPAASLDLR